jgi:hypothetical protein
MTAIRFLPSESTGRPTIKTKITSAGFLYYMIIVSGSNWHLLAVYNCRRRYFSEASLSDATPNRHQGLETPCFPNTLDLEVACLEIDPSRRQIQADAFSSQSDLVPRGGSLNMRVVFDAFDRTCPVLAFGCADGTFELRTLESHTPRVGFGNLLELA